MLKAVNSVPEGIELARDLISLCSDGGWRLCQFTTNNKDILLRIDESTRDACVASLDLTVDELPVERTLGIQWSMETDQFTFKMNMKSKPLTRRGVLSMVLSIYDPSGFACPFIMVTKSLLQDIGLCRLKLSWDTQLGPDETTRWNKWNGWSNYQICAK